MENRLNFPTFYDRFEALRCRMRRHLCLQTLMSFVICLLLGFGWVAALDYWYELPWNGRAAWLALIFLLGLLLMGRMLIASFRAGTRPRLASVLEHRFPELGQTVRTSVEYQGLSDEQLLSRGLAPGLVRALEASACLSTLPLPLESLIPTRRWIVLFSVVATFIVAVSTACLWHSDWQVAFRRALLSNEPFTQVVLATENTIVDQGTELNLLAATWGRVRDKVVLRTRAINHPDNAWEERTFSLSDGQRTWTGARFYETTLPIVTEPFEFQWIAGPDQSEVHRVDVRYPLEITSISAQITPPAYTGMPATASDGGNLNFVEGSRATIVVELNEVPVNARVVLTSVVSSPNEKAELEMVEARIDGRHVSFEKTYDRDVNWQVQATSASGVAVGEHSYRVRVRKDQPPTVVFEEPGEMLDVHALAEVLLRIRARDDFGLSRAGIVFQINNDEEHTLIAETDDREDGGPGGDGQRTAKMTALVERILPLEHFKLIQKDAITYYAFAEDNRPGQPQRTESDLQFIDIRPFKTNFHVPPDNGGDNEPSEERPRRATFEELIGRQRAAMNRALAMKRQPKTDLVALDRLMAFETEIAELTNGLGRFLQEQATQFNLPELLENADLLFQAERAMLDSIDSMSVGKFEITILQHKDAVRFLVESRDRLNVLLGGSESPPGLQKVINSYFRQFRMKLRMKSKQPQNDQQRAVDLLERLESLASRQAIISEQLEGPEDAGVEGAQPDPSAVAREKAGRRTDDIPTDVERDRQSDQSVGTDPDATKGPAPDNTASMSPGSAPRRMTREEISKNQQQIAVDGGEVQKDLVELKQATELVKGRMASAVSSAFAAADALTRGNSTDGGTFATAAAERFEQTLQLLRGLVAPEISGQLAAARDLADKLSRQEEGLAKDAAERAKSIKAGQTDMQDQSLDNGGGKRSSKTTEKERLAAGGESLVDLIENATKSSSAADQRSITKLSDLLNQGGIVQVVEQMKQQSGSGGGEPEEEAKVAADIAGKLTDIVRKLDSLRQEIVDPQVAKLIELDEMAGRLQAELDEVETTRQAEQWHQTAGRFLGELQEMSNGEFSDEVLREDMQQAGWDDGRGRFRNNESGHYDSRRYKKALLGISVELRNYIQELLVAEFSASGTETPPAQYEGMVMKYQRALTMGTQDVRKKNSQVKERRRK